MNWTRSLPSEPGWYWVRVRPTAKPEIVLLVEDPWLQMSGFRVWRLWAGQSETRWFAELPECEWCGPLPAPQEANA